MRLQPFAQNSAAKEPERVDTKHPIGVWVAAAGAGAATAPVKTVSEPEPEATPFKAGDIVRLKSGGPAMTIESIKIHTTSQLPVAVCQWFSSEDLRSGEFALTSISAATVPSH